MDTPSPALINALNLSLNERAVFEALLRLKMARNVSVIAREAELPRTTTSYILLKFWKRNLVRRVMVKKRAKWMYNRLINKIGKGFN